MKLAAYGPRGVMVKEPATATFLPGARLQTIYFENDVETLRKNLYVADKFIQSLGSPDDDMMKVHPDKLVWTDIPFDNVKSVSELAIAINSLYKQARTFQLVTFRIDNIKDLNDEYGRDMGNMVMAEYMKAIIKNFVDEGMIYRVSGLEFSFIITDYRKMDILSRALKKDDKLLKASMKYGSDVITTNVYMGIALSSDVANATQLIEAARKSLKTALLDQVSTNYIYYKDIK